METIKETRFIPELLPIYQYGSSCGNSDSYFYGLGDGFGDGNFYFYSYVIGYGCGDGDVDGNGYGDGDYFSDDTLYEESDEDE